MIMCQRGLNHPVLESRRRQRRVESADTATEGLGDRAARAGHVADIERDMAALALQYK